MIGRLSLACAGLSLILSSVPSFAQCVVSSGVTSRVELLQRTGSAVQSQIELALAQVDTTRCLSAARTTFQALAMSDDDQLKHLGEGGAALVTAREAVVAGNAAQAAALLRLVAERYQEGPIYLRAIQDLSNVLDARPAAAEWTFLAGEFDKIAAAEDVSGLAAVSLGHLALHDIRTGHADTGLMRMESYLARPHSVQIRLTAAVLYLELLLAADHRPDARILSRDLEDDIGSMLLDPAMRVRFLQAATAAYANAADPQSVSRYQRYASALDQAKRELQ